MVFSFTNAPKLSAADMGVPDYANALRKGFQAAADVYKPSTAAAGLLDAMLKNKHSQIINQYLPRSEEARIGHNEALGAATRSNTSMDDLRRQILQQGVSKGEADRTLQSKMMEAFNAPSSPFQSESENTFLQQQMPEQSIVNQGNPNLYKIDEMYASNPLMRKMLEVQGYKQTQTTRFDPKTGSTSVITTSPSGKVTVHSIAGANQGAIGLTNAVKTQMQNIIAGVPKVHKKIDDLIKTESPTNLIGFKPNQRAEHAALVKESAETYAKAKGWPNTNESIKAAMDILDRHTFESDEAYRKRLSRLKESLSSDLKEAKKTLNPGDTRSEDQESSHDMVFNPATGRLE